MLTEERIEEIFAEVNSDWSGDNTFQGLQIIAKYINPLKETIISYSGHDYINTCTVEHLIKLNFSEEDITALAKLNWYIDEYGNVSSFV